MDAKLKVLQPQAAPENSLCPECDTPLMILHGKIVHCDLDAFKRDEDDRAAKRVAIQESLEVRRNKLELLHADAVSLEETDRAANVEFRALKRSLDDLTQQAEVSGEVIDVMERMRRDEAKRLREVEETVVRWQKPSKSCTTKKSVIKVVSDAIKRPATCTIRSLVTRSSRKPSGLKGVRNKLLGGRPRQPQCRSCTPVRSLGLAHGSGRFKGRRDDRRHAYDPAFGNVL